MSSSSCKAALACQSQIERTNGIMRSIKFNVGEEMANGSGKITLAGGIEFHAISMIMYEEALLQEASGLWQEAERKLGVTGGTLGFMGAPSFVLGAFAASSIFSRWQRAKLGRDVADLVEAAGKKYRAALNGGREFAWNEIEGTDWADISCWQAAIHEDLKRKVFVPKPDGDVRIRTFANKWIWVMWKQLAVYEPIPANGETT